ncbi:MAG: LEA type 2 family protein [Zoogloea sp.]|jgi:LEA14-like dessication related protein|uniref:LEA type 2 family protein n=1 Tax=Zoogloea sp. TaxID=49181 RepID=UPI0026169B13|nr:LEA type 2 family protein [Zoogloea sp.]MDD3329382.1 LEA type 2 family protein [Zoogloea sp.]
MLNPSRRRLAGLAAAMLGLTALGGCAGLRLGMQKPEVTVANIRLLDGNLLEQRFLLTLRVMNPNTSEIAIEGLTFKVDLNGQPFAKGVGNQPVVVPRLGEAMVEVTATTGLGGLLRQLKAFKGREKVDYRISGRLVTGNFGGIDFDQTGEVELPKGLGDAAGTGGKGPAEKF